MSKSASKKTAPPSNIIILPESDKNALCVSLHGVISLDDYEEYFFKRLDAIVKSGRKFGLLIHYSKDYKGWSKEAADRSFQSIIEHGKHARKLAYVNPPEAKMFQIKMAKPLFGGDIRFFEEKELDQALAWVKT